MTNLREQYRLPGMAMLVLVTALVVTGVALIAGAAFMAGSEIDVANPLDCRRCGLPTLTANLILVGAILLGTALLFAVIYGSAAWRRRGVRGARPGALIFMAGRTAETARVLKRVAPRVNGTSPLIPAILIVAISPRGFELWGFTSEPILSVAWEGVADPSLGEVVSGFRRVPTLRVPVTDARGGGVVELLPSRPGSDGLLYARLAQVRELASEVDALRTAAVA